MEHITDECEYKFNRANVLINLSVITRVIIEGVRARVSQPLFYNSLPVWTFRT